MRTQTLIFLLFFTSNSVLAQHKAYYTLRGMSRYENFVSGYIDTFSINNARFRIRFYRGNEELPLLLEKFNKRWIAIDSFTARMCEYELSDFNNDGYIDLVADNRWQYFVYLFNPKKKTLTKCGYFSESNSDSLNVISKTENLYYDRWECKWDNWWSYLYTIKNYRRYNLGILEYKYTQVFKPKGGIEARNRYLSIRKINKDVYQKEILVIRNVDFEHFDIKSFWQNKKAKFYPNVLMSPNGKITKMYEPGGLYALGP